MNAPLDPRTALSVRQEFGALQATNRSAETSAIAVAAQAKAMVEARYVMALQRPRNWDQVRQDVMKECHRPAFAHNKSAYYKKPIGAGVEGLGIRFVEVAMRCMTNVLIESTMVYEDDLKEVHRVSVTELESNTTWPADVRVSKTVERAKPMDDGSYISVRKNSYGKDVFTVPATDDDLLNKRQALISKTVRTLGLRIIPGDIQDEAEAIIKSVRLDEAAKDPDAERKKIADAFGGIGVKASDLTAYLGHSLDTCSPAELVDLRGIYGAIKDGEATWKSVMDNKAENEGGKPEGDGKPTPPANKPQRKSSRGDVSVAADPATPSPSTTAPAAGTPQPPAAPVVVAVQTAAAASHVTPPGVTTTAAARASDDEREFVRLKLETLGIAIADACAEVGISDFEHLTADGYIALRELIRSREGK